MFVPLRVVLAVASVLMAFAAYGLSPDLVGDDYCITGSWSREWWPPGLTCEDQPEPGWDQPRTANPAAMFVTLAAGLLLVLVRRSKLAIATSIVFAAAAAGGLLVTPVVLLFTGWVFGGLLALAVTRSLAATVLPMAALFVAYTAQFFDDVPLAWAAVLLALALVPRRVGDAWTLAFRRKSPEPCEPWPE